MNTTTHLTVSLHLLSDATLGRGDGLAGVVDAEVQHDELGLPFLGGKTLKGLLHAECDEILFALAMSHPDHVGAWRRDSDALFGRAGSRDEAGRLFVGDARAPGALREAMTRDLREAELALVNKEKDTQALSKKLEALRGRFQSEILEASTAVRRQTAIDPRTGAPRKETLRTMRVVLRETVLESDLYFRGNLTERQRGLLAACVASLRRVGTGRNRGRGRVRTDLRGPNGDPVLKPWLAAFAKEVNP